MKKIFTVACLMVASLTAVAEDNPFRVGDIFIRVDVENKTAAVVRPPEQYDYLYTLIIDGVFNVPETVEYEGRDYVVTAVGDSAFCRYTNVKKVVK